MPNPSELERRDLEDRPLPKAEKFEITIDFGPHQAKLEVDGATMSALDDPDKIGRAIGQDIAPHIKSMLEAEDRNHG
jgi:hypothetical protein